jgi:WD40 repeat protein
VTFDKSTLACTLTWDADWVTAVSFVGKTRTLAAGNNHGEILLWDVPDKPADTLKPTRHLAGHTNVISHLATTPEGLLISASYDHSIRLWDAKGPVSGKEKLVLNERTIADLKRRSASKIPPPFEAEVEIQTACEQLKGHRDWIQGLSLTLDGKHLATGDDQGHVLLWDVVARKEIRRWQVKGWAYAVALSSDAKRALVSERVPLIFDSGRHGGVRLWDATNGQLVKDLTPLHKEYVSAAAFSPDGKLLALGRGGEADGLSGKITLLDPASGNKLRELTPGHLNGLTGMAYHPDGVHLATCGRDTLIRIWNPHEGKLVRELGKGRGGQFKDWLHAVAFSADGSLLAAADMAGAVQVWTLG